MWFACRLFFPGVTGFSLHVHLTVAFPFSLRWCLDGKEQESSGEWRAWVGSSEGMVRISRLHRGGLAAAVRVREGVVYSFDVSSVIWNPFLRHQASCRST